MGGVQVRIGCRPGQKSTVPHALQIPLPSGTTCQLPPPLGEEAFGVGFSSSLSAKPMVTCQFSYPTAHANSSRVVNRTNFSTHQPARTATIESDVKSLCPFSGRHKGRTV